MFIKVSTGGILMLDYNMFFEGPGNTMMFMMLLANTLLLWLLLGPPP